jgi:hypothetical protein
MGWFEDAAEFVGDVVEDAVETGKEVVEDLVDAAGDAAEAAGDAASDAAEAVTETAEAAGDWLRERVEEFNDAIGRGPEGPLHPIEEDDQGGGQPIEQALVPGREAVLTPVQEAAERLKEASNEAQEDSSPATPVLTAAQEAKQRLQDAWDETHGTSDREEIIKKAVERLEQRESLPGPDLGQGPGPGPVPKVDGGDIFTDLIRAAQNPMELGLVEREPSVQNADAMILLAGKGDFDAPDLGPKGGENVASAFTMPIAAPGDHASIDHDVPVFEQIHGGHH